MGGRAECGGPVGAAFRFCPWCAAPQRRKLVEFFHPHPAIVGDAGKALRVSRYLEGAPDQRHVRFSVWNESGEAQAAVSLPEPEAGRLGRYLLGGRGTPPRSVASLLEQLRRRAEV